MTDNWDDFVKDVLKELKEVIIPGDLFSKNWFAYGKKGNELIYLSVEFQAGGRMYYYKTQDDIIRPGDEIYVPVGNEREQKKVKVKKIEYYLPNNAPFPENKTRSIIGRTKITKDEYFETDVNDSDWLNDLQIPPTVDDDELEKELLDDNKEVIPICPRKDVNLIQVKDSDGTIVEYVFSIMTEWLESIELNQREFDALCSLFDVEKEDYIGGYYYAYGYVAEEKSADAMFRYKDNRFEDIILKKKSGEKHQKNASY